MHRPHGRRAAWLRLSVKASECARISKEFLAEERRILGDRWYAMECENVFGDSVAAVFSSEDIARAATADVKPLFGRAAPVAVDAQSVSDATVKPLFGVPK